MKTLITGDEMNDADLAKWAPIYSKDYMYIVN